MKKLKDFSVPDLESALRKLNYVLEKSSRLFSSAEKEIINSTVDLIKKELSKR